ncbi:hypothetical protein FOL47_004390 [Perkinsus chesapeaki]|uniref:Uncharacterized protein n=1 Tax=Perkinsus chesapeaki TaxID=330153 RepID=A0A7J6N1F9_PERCH|nr:hypothetical protein FOL47_004390 [Perkinsus chesapeaki]
MIRTFNAGTCFCASLRTGMFICILVILITGLIDLMWRCRIYFHENAILYPIVKVIMFDFAPIVLYILIGLNFLIGCATIVTDSGNAKYQLSKVWLICLVLTCIWWMVVGADLPTKLRQLRQQFGLSGALGKAQEHPSRVGKLLRGKRRSTVLQSAAFVADHTVVSVMSETLPEPLGELLWLSMHSPIVLLIFGILPSLIVSSTIVYVGSYAHVVSRGGDGTECVSGERIDRFYEVLAEDEILDASESQLPVDSPDEYPTSEDYPEEI